MTLNTSVRKDPVNKPDSQTFKKTSSQKNKKFHITLAKISSLTPSHSLVKTLLMKRNLKAEKGKMYLNRNRESKIKLRSTISLALSPTNLTSLKKNVDDNRKRKIEKPASLRKHLDVKCNAKWN